MRRSKNGSSPSWLVGRNAPDAAKSRGKTAFLAGQLPDDSLVAVVVRIADEEPVDRLSGQAVLGPKPFEDLGVVLEPPVIVFRQGRQHLMDPQFDQALGLRFASSSGESPCLAKDGRPTLAARKSRAC